MYRWFLFLSFGVLCLSQPALAGAAVLDIPKDYKVHAQQVEFLSHLARKCDIYLRVFGKSGLIEPPCKDFLTKLSGALSVDPARTKQWVHMAAQVDRSSNRHIQERWDTFQAELNANLDIIVKVMDHIKFLR